jgi:hypothetical protein
VPSASDAQTWAKPLPFVTTGSVRAASRTTTIDDDGEQIVAREAADDLRLMRDADDRIAAVDEQRLDRRIGELEQSLAEPGHVQHARRAGYGAGFAVPLSRLSTRWRSCCARA